MGRVIRMANRAYAILDGMKGGKQAHGFTIIETMMVLAASAGLFVAIAAVLAGRQNRTEFSQSIQDIKTQIQQQISDIGSGLYGNTDNFSCSAGATAPILTGVASGDQGANEGCIFLGKALQFKVAGTSDPEQLRIYTIAGLQKNNSGAEVTSYSEARPVVIAPSTASPSIPDASSAAHLLYGLTTSFMNYGSPAVNVGAIAFVSSLASGGGDMIGSQRVNVIPIDSTTLNAGTAATVQAINTNLATSEINPDGGVKICFVSGGTNQSGLITIGGNSRELSVTLSIKENTTCS
jgi:type II secretory pathway pseudopilin PulG